MKLKYDGPTVIYSFPEDILLKEWTFDVKEVAPYVFDLVAKRGSVFEFEMLAHSEDDLLRMAKAEAEFRTKRRP
jgi:hypothetical protein